MELAVESLIFSLISTFVSFGYDLLRIATAVVCYIFFSKNKTTGIRYLTISSIALLVIPYTQDMLEFIVETLSNNTLKTLISAFFRLLYFGLRVAFLYGLYKTLNDYNKLVEKTEVS